MHTDRSNFSHAQSNSGCPELLDLAAYLDGRAREHEAGAIELHLARCSACLEAVREFRQSRSDGEQSLALVPPRVIEHAMALAPATLSPQWWVASRRAAAIAASIAICAVGYQIGGAMASTSASASSADDTATAFFGLLDEDSELESADDLLFNKEGEVS
jgi:anti-sigma factor RsiW